MDEIVFVTGLVHAAHGNIYDYLIVTLRASIFHSVI